MWDSGKTNFLLFLPHLWTSEFRGSVAKIQSWPIQVKETVTESRFILQFLIEKSKKYVICQSSRALSHWLVLKIKCHYRDFQPTFQYM